LDTLTGIDFRLESTVLSTVKIIGVTILKKLVALIGLCGQVEGKANDYQYFEI
jgi:hypothetical protein